jgi:hypothetical protein
MRENAATRDILLTPAAHRLGGNSSQFPKSFPEEAQKQEAKKRN